MQKILSNELDRIEAEAWRLHGVERTAEAAAEIHAWFTKTIDYVVRDTPLDALPPGYMRPEIYPAEAPPATAAQLLFFAVGICRSEIEDRQNYQSAVSLLVLAGEALGMARIGEAMPTMQEIMSLSGKRAAHASHAKDREKAETIEAWWRESRHHYKSMDAAAEAATEIVNVGFRTARKHIGEEAKIIKGKKHDG